MSGSLSMTIGAATILALSPMTGPSAMTAPLASASPPSASAALVAPGALRSAADPRCPYDVTTSDDAYRPPRTMQGLLAEAKHAPRVTVRNGHAEIGRASCRERV